MNKREAKIEALWMAVEALNIRAYERAYEFPEEGQMKVKTELLALAQVLFRRVKRLETSNE